MPWRPGAPSWAGHGDLPASLALCAPLAVLYGLGAAWTGAVSAVDGPSRALWWLCGGDRVGFALVYVGLAVACGVWLARTGRLHLYARDVMVPLVLEAAIYAGTLAAVIDVLLARGLGLSVGVLGGVVGALGAGLHEEVLFRGVGLAGGAWLLRRGGDRPRAGWLAAWVASSLLFAAAHHWAGQPWDPREFGFRALAGAAFGLIFWYRSFAHAVWAHAIYDLYVLAVPS